MNIYSVLHRIKYHLTFSTVHIKSLGNNQQPKSLYIPDRFNTKKITKLCKIMYTAGSDKGLASHNYTTFYSSVFSGRADKIRRVFEMGVGSTNLRISCNMGRHGIPGASLRGWRSFFPNAEIFGADIDKGCLFHEDRISTFFCDQTKPKSIKYMLCSNPKLKKKFDLIVDDGLHNFEANVCFFENFIDKLKKPGLYVIEDVETSLLSAWHNLIESRYLLQKPELTFYLISIPHPTNLFNNNLVVIAKGQ